MHHKNKVPQAKLKRFLVLIIISIFLCSCIPGKKPTSVIVPEVSDTSTLVIPATGTILTTLAIPVVTLESFTPTVAVITDTCTPTSPPLISPTPVVEESLPTPVVQISSATPPRPIFDQFVEHVKNGNARQIVGVYMEDVLGLRVVQQPPNQPAFVSPLMGVATQFMLAFEVAGNIGLLAHNYLSGQFFFVIAPGNIAKIVNGDGNVTEYEVSEIYEYQALNPTSPTSDFLDLNSNQRLSASTLFNLMYMGEHHLTFQTCIARGGESSWGRLFVIAYPF